MNNKLLEIAYFRLIKFKKIIFDMQIFDFIFVCIDSNEEGVYLDENGETIEEHMKIIDRFNFIINDITSFIYNFEPYQFKGELIYDS